jgi:UDP-N-acetylmuramoylalanine--D-glutamate ligase
LGVEPAAHRRGRVRSFPGVEHRLEFVAEIAGVSFLQRLESHQRGRRHKAIEAFPGGLLVILGGKDKDGDLRRSLTLLRQRAREVFLIGAAAEKIEAQLGARRAHRRKQEPWIAPSRWPLNCARPGDTVLLAPACASFDQFENYEHRGRVFKQLVRALAPGQPRPRRRRPEEE